MKGTVEDPEPARKRRGEVALCRWRSRHNAACPDATFQILWETPVAKHASPRRQAVCSSSRRPDDLTAKRIRTRISEEALEAGKQVTMLGTLTGRWAGPEVTAALPCKGAEARRVPGVILGQGHRGTSEEGGLFLHEAYNPGDK